MNPVAHPVTTEDLWLMPDNERRELVRGEVRTMAPTGFNHGAIVIAFGGRLSSYVRKNNLGVVVGGKAGFVLARNPDIVRGADIAFVTASRIPASGLPVKYWEGPPDLAVEVVSPGDTVDEVDAKVQDYLSAGTRLVWVVNPRSRIVTVCLPGAKPVVLRLGESVDGGEIIPGFRCIVAEIFA